MAAVMEFAGGLRADGLPAALSDPFRLMAVEATGLLDTGPEDVFEDLAALAARITGAGRAFVTLVDADRSFWKSCVGVDLTDVADRQNPVHESFCCYLVGLAGEPFVVDDAAAAPVRAITPRSHRWRSAPGPGIRCGVPVAKSSAASASSTTPPAPGRPRT
ncbi:hypothetical protein OHT61_28610 [Streptomyces sp. NBC_00178]